jgi:transposase-like protein
MVSEQKRGISSYQLSQYIQTTQKTAWFMLQRIRKTYGKMKAEKLSGVCTADETYVGGLQKNKHYNKRVKGQQGRGGSEKINVFGVMQVGGMVYTQTVADVKRGTLQSIINSKLVKGSTLMTDEWHGYNLVESNGYYHTVCDHSRYQYVSDTGATTNPIENYWSHVKRAIKGTYYHVSKKHIDRYLAEFDYKFNYRSIDCEERFQKLLSNLPHTRLSYNQLTQK